MATPLLPMKSAAEVLGARLLGEIEEGSLESLLQDLRKQHPTPISKTGIPLLDTLPHHHQHQQTTLTISGRNLALLHRILHHQIHTLTGTVTLLDLTHTFSPSHLSHLLTLEELSHIHVFRCTKANVKVTMQGLEGYMMSCVRSRGREWVGTLVLGGGGGVVNFGWRGRWRVERVMEEGFGGAVSVEEAVEERARREGVWWKVVGDGGEYSWRSS